jgi:hypothetical protein
MNKKPKFYRADGKLTKYALCCGYVYTKNNSSLEMLVNIYKVSSPYNVAYFNKLSDAYKFIDTSKK